MQVFFHKSQQPNSKTPRKKLCLSDLLTPKKKTHRTCKIYDRILQFGPHTLLFAWTGSSPAAHGRTLSRFADAELQMYSTTILFSYSLIT